MMQKNEKLTGVNLGGWLVLEKWMTPELFSGLKAEDEYGFCLELPEAEAKKRLEKHWQTFITKDDFIWIKNHGLNAVRIPVGYWNFESAENTELEPFYSSKKYLDQAIRWANELDLKVIINLHAAPGSQNGWDHSGRAGEIRWHKNEDNIERTLNALETIAKLYGSEKNVVGIELLNEPHWEIPLNTLKSFYKKGYDLIRQFADLQTAVIFHDSFRPNEWEEFFRMNNFENVCLDLHLYQCFSDQDKKLNMHQHLEKTYGEWNTMIEKIQQYVPVIVGEWSLGIDNESLKGLNDEEINEALKLYFSAQKEVFAKAKAEFFWNYKLNNEVMKKNWSYRDVYNLAADS